MMSGQRAALSVKIFGDDLRGVYEEVKRRVDGSVDLTPAVVRAAEERVAPTLMTAVTAALGLLPLALASGRPGSEIQAPMALVTLTGLVTSNVLNMVVVPALLARWGGEPGWTTE